MLRRLLRRLASQWRRTISLSCARTSFGMMWCSPRSIARVCASIMLNSRRSHTSRIYSCDHKHARYTVYALTGMLCSRVRACVHPCLCVHLRWCVQERACGVAPTPTDLLGRVCAWAPTSLLVASTLRSAPPPISSTRAAEPSGLPPRARMRLCVRAGGRVRVCVCAHCWLAVTGAVWRQLAHFGSASH